MTLIKILTPRAVTGHQKIVWPVVHEFPLIVKFNLTLTIPGMLWFISAGQTMHSIKIIHFCVENSKRELVPWKSS